jgi:hypothetical protein
MESRKALPFVPAIFVCLNIAAPTLADAKISRELEPLRDSQFQCNVVYAVQTNNGQVVRSTMNPPSTMTTLNQLGGDDFTDAKCFRIPALDLSGAESVVSFGCLPLTKTSVKKFSVSRLRIERARYNEVLDLNFKTGQGTYSFDTTRCDWGPRRSRSEAQVQLENCIKL